MPLQDYIAESDSLAALHSQASSGAGGHVHLRPPACGRAGWAADAVLVARKLSLPHLRHWKYTLVAPTCADQGVRRHPGADGGHAGAVPGAPLYLLLRGALHSAFKCWTFCHAAGGIPAAPFLLRPVLVRVLGAVSRHPSRGSSPNAQQTVPQCSSNCPSHLPCCSTLACAAVRPGQHVHRLLSAQRTPSNLPLSCSDPCVLQSDLGNISKRCTPSMLI